MAFDLKRETDVFMRIDGRMTRFYLAARNLKSVHPDRPTVEQVRLEIEKGRFVEGRDFVRTRTADRCSTMLRLR